jgi:hypothetical protein
MSDKKTETDGKAENLVPPADSLIKTSKEASVELDDDDLAKVTGGVQSISWGGHEN